MDWMDWMDGLDPLRSLVPLEHLAVLTNTLELLIELLLNLRQTFDQDNWPF